MKLIEELNIDELEFKKMRETNTGSRIIDIDNTDLYQTPWMKIIYEVEYNICIDAAKIQDVLEQIDNRVIQYSAICLEFTEDETREMYRPLLRKSNNQVYFSIPITVGTVLFDRDKTFYNKTEIKDILKVNQHVRFILRFKKLYFKDHNLTFQIELVQIELA
jgi:hypothetical protein